jgi:hypothetical protein
MTAREELQLLIEKLPEGDVLAARRFLEFLCASGDQAVERALQNAPVDDEPFTAEDAAAVEEATRQLQEHGPVSWNEMMRRLGHER